MSHGHDYHVDLTADEIRKVHAMTMRNPLDGEIENVKPKFDPAKSYRYTWPGQEPKVVSGDELAAICKGANHEMLAIEEVGAKTKTQPAALPAAPEKA